ncbi:RICIN domain-containing protein [Actinomadura meridiana]
MRKTMMSALLPVIAILGGLWAVPSASATAPSPRPESQRIDGVLIKPRFAHDLCLEVADSNSGNGALVTAWGCHGRENQRWTIDGTSIKTSLPGHRCLDVRGGNGGNGAAINLYDCNSSSGQQWHFDGDRLVSGVNGHCLTIVAANFAGGGAVVNWECVGFNEQAWELS